MLTSGPVVSVSRLSKKYRRDLRRSLRYGLRAGAGELRCRDPRLPLAAGPYLLRATAHDPATLQPPATLGWLDAPQPFTVRPATTLLNNASA